MMRVSSYAPFQELLFGLVFLVSMVHSHLNLFISQREVRKLLGLQAELFYVREGVINEYAMNFVVPVSAHISELHFSWQALSHRPLSYSIGLDYNEHQNAMDPPKMNISAKGFVPTKVQTFSVQFRCTGRESIEIEVLLQINVTAPNHHQNDTVLNFRRNKICLKEKSIPRNDSIHLNPDSLVSSPGTFYVAVGCACAMIIIVIAVASVMYVKNKKARHQESMHTSYTTAAYSTPSNVFIRMDGQNNFANGSVGSASYATIASFQKVPLAAPSPVKASPKTPLQQQQARSHLQTVSQESSPHLCRPSPSRGTPSPYATTQITAHVYSQPYSPSRVSYYASSQISHFSQATLYDPRLVDPTERIRHLTVCKSKVYPLTLLHGGTFGRIYRGVYQNEDKDREEEVLVKTVSDEASQVQITLLLTEGTMMYNLNHKNILPIISLCFDNQKRPYLLYPYMNKGVLKRFLQQCRPDGEEQYTLLTQDLVDMAVQVALGMIYLHKQRLCHKDLASRNCVLDEKLRVRITDNAIARDLFPNDYHCLGDNENRPIKWMALETLLYNQFSGSSDVWSFGVLLWELTTLAQQPYIEIDPFEMGAYLRDGYRLAQPVNCPDELFAVMACCWLSQPDERPNFVQLLAYLQDFYTALGRYI